jgi:hypothetical protein
MKVMIDRARDLFLENPNQTAEEVAITLLYEYKQVAAHDGVRPDALYAHCLESANLVVKVGELREASESEAITGARTGKERTRC